MSDTEGAILATKIPGWESGKQYFWGVDWASGPDHGIISEWRRNDHGGLEFVRIVSDTQNQGL